MGDQVKSEAHTAFEKLWFSATEVPGSVGSQYFLNDVSDAVENISVVDLTGIHDGDPEKDCFVSELDPFVFVAEGVPACTGHAT